MTYDDLQQHCSYRVRFMPRAEYRGRRLKPSLAALAGRELVVDVLWWMDDEDKYPGEAALGRPAHVAYDGLDVFGRAREAGRTRGDGSYLSWIASGDVEVLERVDHLSTEACA